MWAPVIPGLRGLTFELSCTRRHALQARCVTMVELAHTGLATHAVACQLERGVRRQFAHCCIVWLLDLKQLDLDIVGD